MVGMDVGIVSHTVKRISKMPETRDDAAQANTTRKTEEKNGEGKNNDDNIQTTHVGHPGYHHQRIGPRLDPSVSGNMIAAKGTSRVGNMGTRGVVTGKMRGRNGFKQITIYDFANNHTAPTYEQLKTNLYVFFSLYRCWYSIK